MTKGVSQISCCLLAILTLSLAGCKGKKSVQEVVIYTSLDKVFSQPTIEGPNNEPRDTK